MGALQPGLPSPVAIPKKYFKIVIDIKDCFFSIPLHPMDCKRFAFSIPVVNHIGPNPRFQWRVLPQGMANSPTLCQKYVAQSIDPIRVQFPTVYIVHYMDDLLIAGKTEDETQRVAQIIVKALLDRGFSIAPDKIQTQYPFLFLGFELCPDLLYTQKIQIRRDTLQCLNDYQKLLGDVNWLRPYLKITKGDLRPLEDLLRGDPDPLSPRHLTKEAETALIKVESAIAQQYTGYFDPGAPLYLVIFSTEFAPTGLLWQESVPLLWVHLPMAKRKILPTYPSLVCQIVMRGITLSTRYFGRDPNFVITPYDEGLIKWLCTRDPDWAVLICSYSGEFDTQMPSNKLLQFFSLTPFVFLKNTQEKPIPTAPTIFIDGSKNGKAAYVLNKQQHVIETCFKSAQLVELFAAITVFDKYKDSPFNLYSDSKYVVGALQTLEMVPIIQPTTPTFQMFSELQKLIRQRSTPFYVGHIRAHTGLPGPLAQGNELADLATRSVLISHLESSQVTAAREAHRLHHLNAQTLRQRFSITREQAREIVKGCKNCLMLLPEPHNGVNPWGLTPGQLWQMDVTHVPSFGKVKFIHVTIDTFSGFICASAHSGEATKDVINHMLYTFTVLGQPKSIKTDNGPGYTSNKFKHFCLQLGIKHVTGIPYNPQGQGIVERANQTLKNTLHKLRSQETLFPFKGNQKALLSHALFVLNFLTLDAFGRSAAERHWHPKTQQGFAQALWRDPITGKWNGPDPIIIWGKGSACVYDSKENGARWLPERLVKLYANVNDSNNNANKHNDK
ncbi:PREDICTED: endogenous retrovirus group K member 11 Pol protein-like [Dipodomys ordii]|uniref:Endogenous retrovirus group K member 11 Pol protein-like n=1 Tax=Dipodomys ordii TaxID=10020 RepID=A0A1S3GTJ7_DIPOR|nr:PREDICTED: endogenous retrovirus group K member 11 Pol protein-like [Dipodomys ordii]